MLLRSEFVGQPYMKGVCEGMIEGIRRELRFVRRTLRKMTHGGIRELWRLALFALAALLVLWMLGWP